MLFNSYTFLIFLLLVLPLSRIITSWRLRKLLLLLVSYIFYAAWNPPFVVLLWFSTVADWYFAKGMHRSQNERTRKALLVGSLAVNLGLLAFFKYGGFVLDNFTLLVNHLGVPYQPAPWSILLPVGISFYTFQTLSYTFDVYRRELPAWHSFLDYALYVTFFPQLVAGPIVRASDFLPQCIEPKKGNARQIGWGFSLFVIGLFFKVVIADSLLAPWVDYVYGFVSADQYDFLLVWNGTAAFAMQIYADFAGYSLCAIGLALCFGFVMPDNFRFPYASVGFSEFWRRWHITLSTWLRDYLYIPLGGNRHRKFKTYRNLMITMLLGGLWHGASWLFVIWGGLHGCYLVCEHWIHKQSWAQHPGWTHPLARFGLGLFTFALVCIAWVFFRAQDIDQAFAMLHAMIGLDAFGGLSSLSVPSLFVVAAVWGGDWLLRDKSLEQAAAWFPWWVRSLGLAVMTYMVVISMVGQDHAFIYFQF